MGPDVHFRLTYDLALAEGFPASDAESIARANVGFDGLYPARRSLATMSRHFAPAAWVWSAYYLHRALRSRDLVLLGWSLHCAQDAVAHGTAGERHLLARAGLGRDPDSWVDAPEGVRRRVVAVTKQRLARFGDER